LGQSKTSHTLPVTMTLPNMACWLVCATTLTCLLGSDLTMEEEGCGDSDGKGKGWGCGMGDCGGSHKGKGWGDGEPMQFHGIGYGEDHGNGEGDD
jgi:hypothetical protein